MGEMIVTGVLNGYLPFQGEMEIMMVESSVVRHFKVSGKAWAAMLDRPNCYANLIGRPVLADVEQCFGMIVELRPAPGL